MKIKFFAKLTFLSLLTLSAAIAHADEAQRAKWIVTTKPGDFTQLAVFPAKSDGYTSPSYLISGDKTNLGTIASCTVDPANKIWASVVSGSGQAILNQYPSWNGNISPAVIINSSPDMLNNISFDSYGNAYVPHVHSPNVTSGQIDVFAKGNYSTPDHSVSYTALPFEGQQIPYFAKVSAKGNLYVLNTTYHPETLTGQIELLKFPITAKGDSVPTQIITSSAFDQSPSSFTIDLNNNIWVSDPWTNSIYEFAPDAGINAKPIATINGDKTLLAMPSGVEVDKAGYIYVSNRSNGLITVYAPGSQGNAVPVQKIADDGAESFGPTCIALSYQDPTSSH